MFEAFLMGLAYGFGACSLSCMPYLAPYMMGRGEGLVEGLKGSAAFVSGKVATYSFIAGVTGYLGGVFLPKDLSSLNPLFAAVLILVGVSMLMAGKKKACAYKKPARGALQLFSLGVVTSAVPCAPLSALLISAASSASFTTGLSYGFVYGLGLVFSPMIVAGGLFSFMSKRLSVEKPSLVPMLQRLSAGVFILMGFSYASSLI